MHQMGYSDAAGDILYIFAARAGQYGKNKNKNK